MAIIDLQPILKGKLVELRPLRAADFTALYAVAADPLLWQQHPAADRYMENVFKGFFEVAMLSGGALVVINRSTGHFIGSSRYHGYDAGRDEVEIGWTFLARSHWGGMYNRELKYLMLRHAFGFVNNVVFLVGEDNHRSKRAMEKIGGVVAGRRSDASGNESLMFRITKSGFEQQQWY